MRWPLVHSADLAELYVLMLENGQHGDVFNAAAIDGYPVGKIARAIADKLNVHQVPKIMTVQEAIDEYGSWAAGYAIDQQMSGQKAMRQLDWKPKHRNPIRDIATAPTACGTADDAQTTIQSNA